MKNPAIAQKSNEMAVLSRNFHEFLGKVPFRSQIWILKSKISVILDKKQPF
jgi:hypothetical protein